MSEGRLKLESPWEEVKEKIKERHIDLTDQDLEYDPQNEEDLLGRLEKKMGKNREEVKALIESISSTRNMAG